MNIKQFSAGLLLLSATVFTSCKSGDDGRIESNVSEAVKNDEVKVSVHDKVVTLKGEVKSSAEKARAEAEARKVEAVRSVDNQITVLLPPAPPTPEEVAGAAADIADDKLNREVQAIIIPFPEVKASVDNGVVTLSGNISKPGHVLLMPKIKGLFPRDINDNLNVN